VTFITFDISFVIVYSAWLCAVCSALEATVATLRRHGLREDHKS